MAWTLEKINMKNQLLRNQHLSYSYKNFCSSNLTNCTKGNQIVLSFCLQKSFQYHLNSQRKSPLKSLQTPPAFPDELSELFPQANVCINFNTSFRGANFGQTEGFKRHQWFHSNLKPTVPNLQSALWRWTSLIQFALSFLTRIVEEFTTLLSVPELTGSLPHKFDVSLYHITLMLIFAASHTYKNKGLQYFFQVSAA